ncbi:MAG TPA: SpoIIE family protein phosphatase [Acidimicrobiales bacterium]|nr:SpoIIE family protein phosphatase [Acidimicrobiales bacterium]
MDVQARGRLTLQRKLQLLISGVAVVMTSTIGLIASSISDQSSAVAAFDRVVPAVDDVNSLSVAMTTQQSSARGFVATADETILQPYVDARQQTAILFGRLERELSADRKMVAQVHELERLLERWQRGIERYIDGARAGESTAAAEGLVVEGERLFAPVRTASRALAVDVNAEVDRAADAVSSSRSRVAIRVAFAALVSAVLLVLGAAALRRWVVLPVRDLSAQVTTVAGGELRRPIEAMGTGLELVQLGVAVNSLRRRLVDEIEALERANEALKQDAPVTVALRAQLEPAMITVPPAYEVAARLVPAEGELAGDWYDLVELPGGRLGVGIGDVCGHGAEAGLLALRAKIALVTALGLGRDPGIVLQDVAAAFGRPDSFVTAFVAVLDPATGECRFAGAGHPPALLLDADGYRALPSTGPLIGMFDSTWETTSVTLDPGGTLVLYTDGLTEARDRARHEFGIRGVVSALATKGQASAGEQLGAVVDAVHGHDGGRLQDDVTIVIIKSKSGRPSQAVLP